MPPRCRNRTRGWHHVRAMTDNRSPMRTLRAALFAAVCVTLAAVGHVSMAGRDLPFTALLLAFAVTAFAAWLMGTRRRGALSIGAGLLGVQGALHLVFAASGTHAGSADGRHGAASAHRGMAGTANAAKTAADTTGSGLMAADPTALATTGTDALTAQTAMGAGSLDPHTAGGALTVADTTAAEVTTHLTQFTAGPGGMLAVHVLAAVVCALWLARGEAAFFQLARTIGTLALAPLRLLLAVATVPEFPHPVRPRRRTRRLHGVVLAHSVSRRGPPRRSLTRTTVPGALV